MLWGVREQIRVLDRSCFFLFLQPHLTTCSANLPVLPPPQALATLAQCLPWSFKPQGWPQCLARRRHKIPIFWRKERRKNRKRERKIERRHFRKLLTRVGLKWRITSPSADTGGKQGRRKEGCFKQKEKQEEWRCMACWANTKSITVI